MSRSAWRFSSVLRANPSASSLINRLNGCGEAYWVRRPGQPERIDGSGDATSVVRRGPGPGTEEANRAGARLRAHRRASRREGALNEALAGIGVERQEAEDEQLTEQLARIPDLSKALQEATPAIKRQVFASFDLQIADDKAERRVELSATVSEAIADAFENEKALQMEGSTAWHGTQNFSLPTTAML